MRRLAIQTATLALAFVLASAGLELCVCSATTAQAQSTDHCGSRGPGLRAVTDCHCACMRATDGEAPAPRVESSFVRTMATPAAMPSAVPTDARAYVLRPQPRPADSPPFPVFAILRI